MPQHDADSGLTNHVREQISGQRVEKTCRVQQVADPGANVRPDISLFCLDFRNKRSAPIDYGHEIFEIAASEEIPLAPPFERFKLRRDKRSSDTRCHIGASIAARYQRLESPRIFSSNGMASRIVTP
jgi:hypothetical protein